MEFIKEKLEHQIKQKKSRGQSTEADDKLYFALTAKTKGNYGLNLNMVSDYA